MVPANEYDEYIILDYHLFGAGYCNNDVNQCYEMQAHVGIEDCNTWPLACVNELGLFPSYPTGFFPFNCPVAIEDLEYGFQVSWQPGFIYEIDCPFPNFLLNEMTYDNYYIKFRLRCTDATENPCNDSGYSYYSSIYQIDLLQPGPGSPAYPPTISVEFNGECPCDPD